MTPRIALEQDPGDAEREAILAPLVAYNEAAVGTTERRPVVLTVRDNGDAIVGGLWGSTAFRWLFVQYLVVPSTMRGQGVGRDLMQRAEIEARRLGCVGIWLDTYSFQARGFYERLGYDVFGEIADYPPGETKFYLHKRIA